AGSAVWRDGDANCCPTGGWVCVGLDYRGEVLVIDTLRHDPQDNTGVCAQWCRAGLGSVGQPPSCRSAPLGADPIYDLSRISRTVARSCLMLIGLPWKPSNPAAMMRFVSWVLTEAVMAMTGVGRVTGSARNSCRASMPLMPGSWMSIRMGAGCRSCARRTPSS